MVAKREAVGGEVEWEVGLARCKVLLHRMDKQQGPAVYQRELYSISYDGKEYLKGKYN